MQIESLMVFCDVARTASFSRGAAEHGVSQSTASQAVHNLEERLGVQLIDRSKRPLILTAHGRAFYEECRELVGRFEALVARVQALGDDRHVAGTVKVAAIYSVGLAHMTRYVSRFRELFPAAQCRIDYTYPAKVVEAVREGTTELGLVSYPRKWADLTVVPWREEAMVVVVSPAHKLAGQESVEVGQLDGEAFVHFNDELPIRRAIDRFLRQRGVQVEPAVVFDNIENVKRAVEVGVGAAILPEPTLAREVASGTLVALPLRGHRLTRPLAVVHRGAAGLAPTAARFLAMLTAVEPTATEAEAAGQPAGASGRA